MVRVCVALCVCIVCVSHLTPIRVYVSYPNAHEEHAGVVHLVEADTALLHFDRKFLDGYLPGVVMKIRFEISRTPLRRMHQAVRVCSVRCVFWLCVVRMLCSVLSLFTGDVCVSVCL